MKLKPSEDYYDLLDSYKELHKEEGKFRGISLVPLVPTLYNIINKNNCKTLLDYGCGKAIPYSKKECKSIGLKKPVQELCNLDSFDLYDPAYPKYDKLSKKKYDIVVCTDVMEHIAEQDIDYVLKDILEHSKKTVFLNISCQLALKHFKEGKFKGKNVHVSVFNGHWWSNKIKNIWNNFKHLKIYIVCVSKDYTHIDCIEKEKR
jgi:hypothetical protein